MCKIYLAVFENNVGLLQGEVLSPLFFFTLYVNDLENEFTIKRGNTPTELQLLSLYLLMYADDMVLLTESINELQNMLNILQNYTTEWSLDVNIQKSKVVVLRNGGQIHSNEYLPFSGENVE